MFPIILIQKHALFIIWEKGAKLTFCSELAELFALMIIKICFNDSQNSKFGKRDLLEKKSGFERCTNQDSTLNEI